MSHHPTFGRRIFYTRSNIRRSEDFNRFAPPIIDLVSAEEDYTVSTDTDESEGEMGIVD